MGTDITMRSWGCRHRCQLLEAVATQGVCGYHLRSHWENQTTIGVLSLQEFNAGDGGLTKPLEGMQN